MLLITLHLLKCLFFVLNWCYFSRGVKEAPFDNLHFRFVWAMRGRALEVTIAKIISWTEKAEKNKNSQHDTLSVYSSDLDFMSFSLASISTTAAFLCCIYERRGDRGWSKQKCRQNFKRRQKIKGQPQFCTVLTSWRQSSYCCRSRSTDRSCSRT